MIIFHEGLPGSGKSYEAAINQIIPALKKGRKVHAYIEGLNHEKFAEVTGLPLVTIQAQLVQIEKEQVTTIYKHVPNDCLVVLDELQDFWPARKETLEPGITEFVTQHRHRGIDIVAMGQDHRDCHMLWKRRIDTLISFVKRDAIGQPKAYTWRTHKQQGGKFTPIRSGKGDYDAKYFGLYKSHSDGVTDIDVHKDDRANVFKGAAFTLYIPAFLAIVIVSGYYLWGFFHDGGKMVNGLEAKKNVNPSIQVSQQAPPMSPPPAMPLQAKEQGDTQQQPKQKAVEYGAFIEKYLEQYRLRLSAYLVSSDKKRMYAQIDFYDGDRIKDRFSHVQLAEFGYIVEPKAFGVLITKDGKSYPATSWPLDIQRNVSDRKRPALRDDGG